LTEQATKTCEKIVNILLEKKAQDVAVVDISDMTVIADAFVVCSGRTPIQVRALADELEEKLAADKGEGVLRREGLEAARWIVLDLGSVLVHIFHREEREFYNLERLWNNGKNIIRYAD
jgi:ribosome-associated protein